VEIPSVFYRPEKLEREVDPSSPLALTLHKALFNALQLVTIALTTIIYFRVKLFGKQLHQLPKKPSENSYLK